MHEVSSSFFSSLCLKNFIYSFRLFILVLSKLVQRGIHFFAAAPRDLFVLPFVILGACALQAHTGTRLTHCNIHNSMYEYMFTLVNKL